MVFLQATPRRGTATLLLLAALIAVSVPTRTLAFSSVVGISSPVVGQRTPSRPLNRLSSETSGRSGGSNSRDEEIAKLEERLKLLKDQKERQSTTAVVVNQQQEEDEEEVSIGMFLSEGWKENEAERHDDANNNRGGALIGVLGAVTLAIFLAAFSQVPIGQEDLSKVRIFFGVDRPLNLLYCRLAFL